MSDFFAPPPKPEKHVEVRMARRSPHEPPPGVLPAVVDTGRALGEAPGVAVSMSRLWVYPEGFEVALQVDLKDEDDDLDPFGTWARRRGEERADPADDLHFGFGLADGSKATNLIGARSATEDGSRPPALTGRGGGSDGRAFRHSFWLSPLVPEPIEVAFEWRAAGIELTRRDLDAEAIATAALRAQRVFAEEEEA
jgi:hypothetical protein